MQQLILYPKTSVISTLEDQHGERRTKHDLDSFLSSLPKRIPIGLHHDMGRITNGYIENFDVVPIDEQPGEWKLIGDFYYDKKYIADETLRGLSLSFTSITMSNSEKDPEGFVFLPFPHYRNEKLNNLLLETSFPLAVGRWHRKSVEIEPVGLIMSCVLFALSPLWCQVYDHKIRPIIAELLQSLSCPEFDGVAFDYVQTITLDDNREIRLLFVSDHAEWRISLEPENIRQGIEVAFAFLTENDLATVKPVEQLRLKYDSAIQIYRPILIQYDDGEHITLP